MNALGRFLSQSVMIESQTRIDTIRRNGSYFVLTTATGTEYSAEQVLVTTPVDQMADLLAQFEIAPIVGNLRWNQPGLSLSLLGIN